MKRCSETTMCVQRGKRDDTAFGANGHAGRFGDGSGHAVLASSYAQLH